MLLVYGIYIDIYIYIYFPKFLNAIKSVYYQLKNKGHDKNHCQFQFKLSSMNQTLPLKMSTEIDYDSCHGPCSSTCYQVAFSKACT